MRHNFFSQLNNFFFYIFAARFKSSRYSQIDLNNKNNTIKMTIAIKKENSLILHDFCQFFSTLLNLRIQCHYFERTRNSAPSLYCTHILLCIMSVQYAPSWMASVRLPAEGCLLDLGSGLLVNLSYLIPAFIYFNNNNNKILQWLYSAVFVKNHRIQPSTTIY